MRSKLLAVAIAAGLGVTSFYASADPAPASQSSKTSQGSAQNAEIQALKAQLQALQAKVVELEQRTDAQSDINVSTGQAVEQVQKTQAATTEQIKKSADKIAYKGVNITLGGFLAAETIYRSANQGADIASNFNTIPFNYVPTAHTNELRFTARQSRISALAQGDVDPQTHLAGYIELDFLGAAQTANSNESNSYNPRIRNVYSRVKPLEPTHSTYDGAKLLLDRGADPKAYTLKQNDPPGSDDARRFTALTGLVGGGSTGFANQPPHPHWRELAKLLLDRGADPADEQALWINPGASLEILLPHGLTAAARVKNITLLGRELSRAAHRGHADRVRLLLAHSARTDEMFEGRTPWEHAMESGNLDIVRLLEDAGAPPAQLSDVEQFTARCLAGDECGARAMLDLSPDLIHRAPKSMVLKATGTGRVDAVRLVLDLGFDPNCRRSGGASQRDRQTRNPAAAAGARRIAHSAGSVLRRHADRVGGFLRPARGARQAAERGRDLSFRRARS